MIKVKIYKYSDLETHNLFSNSCFTDIASIDKVRSKVSRSNKTSLNALPPTQDALHLHIKRSHYQSLVWKKSLEPCPVLPSPEGNGWIREEESLRPQLMTKDPVSADSLQLSFCGDVPRLVNVVEIVKTTLINSFNFNLRYSK